MSVAYIVFEPEEIVVRTDEILRFEPVVVRPTTAHIGEGVPDNARSKVFTKSTGWFFTSLETATILERLTSALDID